MKADAYTGSIRSPQLVLWTPNPIRIMHIKTSHYGRNGFSFRSRIDVMLVIIQGSNGGQIALTRSRDLVHLSQFADTHHRGQKVSQ